MWESGFHLIRGGELSFLIKLGGVLHMVPLLSCCAGTSSRDVLG